VPHSPAVQYAATSIVIIMEWQFNGSGAKYQLEVVEKTDRHWFVVRSLPFHAVGYFSYEEGQEIYVGMSAETAWSYIEKRTGATMPLALAPYLSAPPLSAVGS
jgi:hypothetical protein